MEHMKIGDRAERVWLKNMKQMESKSPPVSIKAHLSSAQLIEVWKVAQY